MPPKGDNCLQLPNSTNRIYGEEPVFCFTSLDSALRCSQLIQKSWDDCRVQKQFVANSMCMFYKCSTAQNRYESSLARCSTTFVRKTGLIQHSRTRSWAMAETIAASLQGWNCICAKIVIVVLPLQAFLNLASKLSARILHHTASLFRFAAFNVWTH